MTNPIRSPEPAFDVRANHDDQECEVVSEGPIRGVDPLPMEEPADILEGELPVRTPLKERITLPEKSIVFRKALSLLMSYVAASAARIFGYLQTTFRNWQEAKCLGKVARLIAKGKVEGISEIRVLFSKIQTVGELCRLSEGVQGRLERNPNRLVVQVIQTSSDFKAPGLVKRVSEEVARGLDLSNDVERLQALGFIDDVATFMQAVVARLKSQELLKEQIPLLNELNRDGLVLPKELQIRRASLEGLNNLKKEHGTDFDPQISFESEELAKRRDEFLVKAYRVLSLIEKHRALAEELDPSVGQKLEALRVVCGQIEDPVECVAEDLP